MLTKSDLEWFSDSYPLMAHCLRKYAEYVCEKLEDELARTHSLIWLLHETRSKGENAASAEEILGSYEHNFEKARVLLGVNREDFRQVFGFKQLRKEKAFDPFHDVVSEILLSLDLEALEFQEIEKLRKDTVRFPDYACMHGQTRYAVELKTVRPLPLTQGLVTDASGQAQWVDAIVGRIGGGPLGQATDGDGNPLTEEQRLEGDLRSKIRMDEEKLLEQLTNARQKLGVERTMLFCDNQRMYSGSVLAEASLEQVKNLCERVAQDWPAIDNIALKWMNSKGYSPLVVPPIGGGNAA